MACGRAGACCRHGIRPVRAGLCRFGRNTPSYQPPYLLSFGLAILGVALLYRFGPSRANARFQWISAGATIACTAWVLASTAFAFYVSNFGTYNETFGTLGGVVVLLMWFWISAFIVLLGAELNAETEAQTRRDTTTGPRAPMGERGAVKADQLGKRRPA